VASPLEAARALLGARLVRGSGKDRREARIVEVEAYDGPEDRASHARFGSTSRNAVMFGPAGIAYVYLVYGMYDCLNIVSGPVGMASAVLIRAVEPLVGDMAMRADRIEHAVRVHRSWDAVRHHAEVMRVRRIPRHLVASGPGAVAASFGIDRTLTGADLCTPGGDVRLEHDATGLALPNDAVRATPRIGVRYAGEPWASIPWRLVIAGHPSVSGPAAGR
jgi:DNA-3-methyladenine glycosylase